IFDRVWSDVIVSDSALTQAVRILRRTLGDDPREPRFIRTVSRHGYRFMHPEVHEEADDDAPVLASAAPQAVATTAPSSAADAAEKALETLLRPGARDEDDEAARLEAAVALHQSGTADALVRLDRRPGHERARAHLRDTRWDVAGAGAVPFFGAPG